MGPSREETEAECGSLGLTDVIIRWFRLSRVTCPHVGPAAVLQRGLDTGHPSPASPLALRLTAAPSCSLRKSCSGFAASLLGSFHLSRCPCGFRVTHTCSVTHIAHTRAVRHMINPLLQHILRVKAFPAGVHFVFRRADNQFTLVLTLPNSSAGAG